MPRAVKPGFYAVARGRVPGIYSTWAECQAQVSGFAGNKHQKFQTAEQARAYLAQHGVGTGPGLSDSLPSSASGSASGSSSTLSTSAASPAGVACPSKHRQHGTKPYSKPATDTVTIAGAGSSSSRWATLTTEVIEDESGWDVVYSDGACKGNGKPGSVAGVGVWWGANDARNLAERCPGGQTNNRAELTAIVRVLETTPYSKWPLLIKTDSKYSISCFRDWLPKWLRNGFKSSTGQPVKNAPLIRYLSALLDHRARQGQKIHLQYVKGHAGEEGNEGADWLANMGATMLEQPERDWDALIDGLQDLTEQLPTKQQPPAAPSLPTTGPSQAELEAYVAGLAADAELLAELAAS